jgi:hypothetical protein
MLVWLEEVVVVGAGALDADDVTDEEVTLLVVVDGWAVVILLPPLLFVTLGVPAVPELDDPVPAGKLVKSVKDGMASSATMRHELLPGFLEC